MVVKETRSAVAPRTTAFRRRTILGIALPVLLAPLALGLLAMFDAEPAEARGGRRGGHGRIVVRAPVVHFGVGYRAPYYGGYGHYYPGHYYGYNGPRVQPEGGINPQIARLNGWGALDLDIKPRKAEVWVDGQFVATAGELDGYPAYLWLDEGRHVVTISKGGYQTWESVFDVTAGQVTQVKLKMVQGPSTPPPGRR